MWKGLDELHVLQAAQEMKQARQTEGGDAGGVGGMPMARLLGGFYDFPNPGERSIKNEPRMGIYGQRPGQESIHQTEYLMD